MKAWERALGKTVAAKRSLLTLNDLASVFASPDTAILPSSWGNIGDEELIGSWAEAYEANGPVFALILARLQVFSQARFQWTRWAGGTPHDLFGSADLSILEYPWPGGTTADLLARMEVDGSLAGNAFIRRIQRGDRTQGTYEDRLARLRPEWCTILLGSRELSSEPWLASDVEFAGVVYRPNGGNEGSQFFSAKRGPDGSPAEVAHYAPLPDPVEHYRGMSWVRPVIRTVTADDASEVHKRMFFQNAAPQPLDAKVLTPAGWTTMGALQVDDRVIGVDGKPHAVVGVFPQGVQDIYRVHFTDGSSTECTDNHVWRVASAYDRKKGTHRVLSLAEMVADGLRYESGPAKWSVPLVEPVQFDAPADLPVDPYLLGLLLGDGSFRSNGNGSGGVTLATAAKDADETAAMLEPVLPAGCSIRRRDRGGWSEFYFRGPGSPRENPLTARIRDLGLWDVPGAEKFIPADYLRADISDRVAVLQGLIDSDGSVQDSAVRFTTTSRRLADDLVELVGSLGGTSSVATVERGYRPQWTVTVKRLPEGVVPARLARKAAAFRPISRVGRYRYIDRVEYVGRKPAQCIRVDSDDHLYVTDDHIVTHNTPNFAIKFDPSVKRDQVIEFKELLEEEHQGALNAYKTLYLGGGADPVSLGKDFQQMDFSATQGKGESRLAAAAGVPPSWVGFSEGLQGSALNAGNFTAARRRFADGTLAHLWASAARSLEPLIMRPPSRTNEPPAQLWYDTRSIPFLREDAKDHAAVQAQEAATMQVLIQAGYTPESVTTAVQQSDWSKLVHSGLVSVQLQTPGADPAPTSNGGTANA